jgi:hypothetical protein
MIDREVSRVLKKAWNVFKWSRRIVNVVAYYTTELWIGFVFLHSNTVPRTNNNGSFFVKYLFIYFSKPSSTVFHLIFQNFNNWGISMQSYTLHCVHICNNKPKVGNQYNKRFFTSWEFNFQPFWQISMLKFLRIILCQTSVRGTIHSTEKEPNKLSTK